MPIFEFYCKPCDKVFEELFRSHTEKKRVKCPKCGGGDVSKKFSVFGMKTAGDPGSSKGSSGGGCGSCSKSSCSGCH